MKTNRLGLEFRFIMWQASRFHGNYTPSDDLIPYGVGPRTCFAAYLARMELFLQLVLLFQNYDVTPAGPLPGIYDGIENYYVWPKTVRSDSNAAPLGAFCNAPKNHKRPTISSSKLLFYNTSWWFLLSCLLFLLINVINCINKIKH